MCATRRNLFCCFSWHSAYSCHGKTRRSPSFHFELEFMLLNCKLWDFQSHKGLERRSSFSGKLFSSYISHFTTKKVTIYFVFWVYILIQNLKWDNHHLNSFYNTFLLLTYFSIHQIVRCLPNKVAEQGYLEIHIIHWNM